MNRILAFRTFPYPDNGPGTRRFVSFCRHLSESGMDVTLVAFDKRQDDAALKEVDPLEGTNVRRILLPSSPRNQSILRRIRTKLTRTLFPRLECFSRETRLLTRAAIRILGEEQFDVILTTCLPLQSLHVARNLSHLTGVPWIADLRDLPDQFDCEHNQRITRLSVDALRSYCRTAAHIITVSPPLKARIDACYHISVPVSVVYNGYVEEDYKGLQGVHESQTFDITYAGSLYAGRSPKLLFEGLDLLLAEGASLEGVRVCFYGQHDIVDLGFGKWKSGSLATYGGKITAREALNAQLNSAILLSLSSPGAKGILSSKVFEYAFAKRPILSIPPDHGVLDEFIERSRTGRVCSTAEEVAAMIKPLLQDWQQSRQLPVTHPEPDYLSQFSRREQAMNVESIIKHVIAAH